MAAQRFSTQFRRVNRRRFLLGSAAALAGTSAPGAVAQAQAAEPGAMRAGFSQHQLLGIVAWNVGLITACRPELTRAENEARNAELLGEIRARNFGVLHLRGRYIEHYGSSRAKVTNEHAYLVFGNVDDSGNLKGFLRKYGRSYDQDSVIHKGCCRDAQLQALRDLPALGMNDRDTESVGCLHQGRLGALHTLMTRGGAIGATTALDLTDLRCDARGIDWLGGHWDDIGLWTPKSFFSRVERRVIFDAGVRPAAGFDPPALQW